jgi:hypothetical protein
MRRTLATTAAGLLLLGALAGCSSDDVVSDAVETASDGKVKVDNDGKKITVEGEDGEGSVSFGDDTELPDDFPSDVPLPEGGDVKAVIKGDTNGKQYFNVTYGIDRDDVESSMSDYKSTLEDDGFEIKGSTEIGSAAGGLASFTAVGADWDVMVYSVGSSAESQAALSIQVMTHDPANDNDDGL